MSQELRILPVFVSSTSLDLRPEREAVRDAVLRIRETQFVGMEYFGARNADTRTASLDEVDRSRVYVGIVGERYGSGITEAEYDRATALGLRRFIYFKSDAPTPDDARLAAFKQKLLAAHTVKEFSTPDGLAAQVTSDLHRWLFDEYVTPKLQAALRGEVSRAEAQALLTAVRDLSALGRDLVTRLQGAGFSITVGGNFIGRDNITNIYNAPPPAVSAPVIPTLHQLRAPVGDFVGREKEIGQLLIALRGGASAAISGISGMGGIGKTELAFYVAERLRDLYTDAQLVVDMRGTDDTPRDAGDALAACIRAFVGVEQRLPDDLHELTRIYRSVLEGKRVLILLDNARDSAQARPLMPPAGSALLVTSRETVALPGMRRVTLEQLEPAEARELLRGIAPHVPADTSDRICFLCGYLPLAIRAAGSLLDVTADLAPETYAEQLQDERRRLELIGAEGVDLGVEASFGLSYARLTEDAARVFRQLAAFPATFDARAEETICEDPDHKHLTDLLRRNLVRYNKDTQRYSLHDLARLFADSRMSDDEGHATRMRYAAHYLTVLVKSNDLYLKGGDAIKSGLALFDVERRNIEAGQEWACRHSSDDETVARLCNDYPDAGAYLLILRQHPREYISWLEAALVAARQLKDRISEGAHLGNLGNAYREVGEMQRAVELNEQCLIIAREIHNRYEEGKALGNLGSSYYYMGKTQQAIELYKQDLIIAREIGDRRGEGTVLGNLGVAYRNLGEPQRAVEFHEQYLAIARELGDRHGEGIALFNASLALDILGNRAKAFAHAEAALEIFEQIESPYVDRVRAQLAWWRGKE
ncbi:MAG TPA: tetratricopeptide repeat protein [Pyrinomonadaceae bacterium]|jgi:tetratricopeptide (TPR) repeat protein|nr:tetratricopeptide repeat protein [Pyrinomonadaceae bacterium]